MSKTNFHIKCQAIIEESKREDSIPSLLLHSCCAPCSSHCIEWLSQCFDITVYFFNPNIYQKEEYDKRKAEQIRLINEIETLNSVKFIDGEYNSYLFEEMVHGLEDCPEGKERCFLCYKQRMLAAAHYAKQNGFDYFCTTLSISPLKNAEKINEIGYKIQEETGVKWLPSDFKKKDGYKRSIQLSEKYGLYRQNFCGCVYSLKQANARKEQNNE